MKILKIIQVNGRKWQIYRSGYKKQYWVGKCKGMKVGMVGRSLNELRKALS